MTISTNEILFLFLCALSGLLVLLAALRPNRVRRSRKGDRHV